MANSSLQYDDLQSLLDNQPQGQERAIDVHYYIDLLLRRRWFVHCTSLYCRYRRDLLGRFSSQEISGRNPDFDRTPESAGQLCAGHRIERSRSPDQHHQRNDHEPDQPAQDNRKFQPPQWAQICRHVPG